MRRVNFVHPNVGFGSFYYVSKCACAWLDPSIKCVVSNFYLPKHLNIRVDCIRQTINNRRPGDIYWLDDFFLPPSRKCTKPLFVTSVWNKRNLESVGYHVEGVIPRLPSPLVFSTFDDRYDREYDFIFIGYDYWRKGIDVLERLVKYVKCKYIAICDYRVCTHRFGSLSDIEKIRLFRKARFLLWLSRVEGFGVPPLEAMLLGTAVIYTDVPAHNEFTVGIKIPASKEPRVIKSLMYGGEPFYAFDYSFEDVVRVVTDALRMTKDEWQDLVHRAREVAERLVIGGAERLNEVVLRYTQ